MIYFGIKNIGYLGGEIVSCYYKSLVKNLPAMTETEVPTLGQEDLLEKENATHSSILAWTEEPGRLLHGVSRVTHDLETKAPNHQHKSYFLLFGGSRFISQLL